MKKQSPEALTAPQAQAQRRNDREDITRCFVVSRETLHKFHGLVAAEVGASDAASNARENDRLWGTTHTASTWATRTGSYDIDALV